MSDLHPYTHFSFAMTTTYKIKLPHFEGPFDLLIFFIERDELDIYDIPIAKITDDFFSYLKEMEEKNLEIASEFILMASTLMQIKVKMLLPRPELDEQGQEIDPREELIRRLVEYKKYKGVVKELEAMEDERALLQARGFIEKEMKLFEQAAAPGEQLETLDLYKLLKVFHEVMQRHKEELTKPRHTVYTYAYTVEGQKKYIAERILSAGEKGVDFVSLLLEGKSSGDEGLDRFYIIFNFLAILELVQEKSIQITIGEGYNNFWLSSKAEPAGPA